MVLAGQRKNEKDGDWRRRRRRRAASAFDLEVIGRTLLRIAKGCSSTELSVDRETLIYRTQIYGTVDGFPTYHTDSCRDRDPTVLPTPNLLTEYM